MRASPWATVPMFVDESVGNIWIQECQELGGAGRRKQRLHGRADYSLQLYLSAKSGQEHLLNTTCLLQITYAETRNTFLNLIQGDGASGVVCRGAAAQAPRTASRWPQALLKPNLERDCAAMECQQNERGAPTDDSGAGPAPPVFSQMDTRAGQGRPSTGHSLQPASVEVPLAYGFGCSFSASVVFGVAAQNCQQTRGEQTTDATTS